MVGAGENLWLTHLVNVLAALDASYLPHRDAPTHVRLCVQEFQVRSPEPSLRQRLYRRLQGAGTYTRHIDQSVVS